MSNINQRIEAILKQSKSLREKHLADNKMQLDYVAIFASDNQDYDQLCEELGKIGEIVSENTTGITFQINKPLETLEGKLALIKARKPDAEHPELGAPDYAVDDYAGLKDKVSKSEKFKIVQASDGVELIELMDEEFDVRLYIPSVPFFKDLKDSSRQNSNSTDSELEKQLENEKKARLALMADFQNYQRRVEGEKALFGAMANIGIIQEILEIFDDMNLALNDDGLNLDGAKSSIKTAQEKLLGAIERAGVERISVNLGDEFNKEYMEAISAVAVQEEDKKNKIIAVISSAYKYKGRDGVIKAAKVVVGK